MKRILLVFFACISFSAWADETIPETGPHFVLKYYNGVYDGSKVIPFSSICNRSKQELIIVRNEIFAKYGRPFKSEDLRKYFESTDWYAVNPLYHDSLLSDSDRENIRRISAVENRLTDDDGLFEYLDSGKTIQSDDPAFYAKAETNDEGEKEYVLYFSGEDLYHYDGELHIPGDIMEKNRKTSWERIELFRYENNFYIYSIIYDGMHGEVQFCYVFQFSYNRKTHRFGTLDLEWSSRS